MWYVVSGERRVIWGRSKFMGCGDGLAYADKVFL